uniref:Uncharacterized protein n=1 Tax=viral metagenome TaxID=1070528 RepID=A0A6M3LKL6_9ZZZZ
MKPRSWDAEWREMSGEDLFRPRDEWDADIPPGSLRGEALALMDAAVRVTAEIDATIAALPWPRRWPARAVVALVWGWIRLVREPREMDAMIVLIVAVCAFCVAAVAGYLVGLALP